MSYLSSYKKLSRLIQDESFEPLISWGFRMALSGTLPVVWGLATDRVNDAIWITLTAEAISWVEMKGAFAWRVRTLLSGAMLAIFFAVLGTLTATNVWLSVVSMFFAGYIATVLKDIGDRASGLAICVYLSFILCNAYPVPDVKALEHRLILISIGAAWPVLVGVFVSLFRPEKEPFRRQIALIWRTISELVDAVSRNRGDGKGMEQVYQKENDVRTVINKSYEFYGRMAHQVDNKDAQQYQLTLLRKTAGLVSVNVIAMGEEMLHISVPDLDETLRVKAATLYSALKESVGRIAIYVISLKSEEKALAVSHINRIKKLTTLIRGAQMPADERQVAAIMRILQLTDRTVRLLEHAILRIDQMGDDKTVFRSYSFTKTLFILKPQYFFGSLRVLVNFNSFTTRYALRSAIAASVALFLFKWFHIDHGYWMPFSVMIIIQPFFAATFKRAMDRVVGTLLGGIAGGLLLHVPAGLHFKELVLFLTFIFMVYYVRKKYSIAAFVITLNLVLLFNLDESYNNMLMVTRALCTIGGALLAIVAGFALLPTWDKNLLPANLAAAVQSNYDYFMMTFFGGDKQANWLRYKRTAESRNSNVFDSFKRYMNDPGREKTEIYYDLITNNVRITRNLNNIHAEQDERRGDVRSLPEAQLIKIRECYMLFHSVLKRIGPSGQMTQEDAPQVVIAGLNDAQAIYLEKLAIELKTMHEDLGKMPAETNV